MFVPRGFFAIFLAFSAVIMIKQTMRWRHKEKGKVVLNFDPLIIKWVNLDYVLSLTGQISWTGLTGCKLPKVYFYEYKLINRFK